MSEWAGYVRWSVGSPKRGITRKGVRSTKGKNSPRSADAQNQNTTKGRRNKQFLAVLGAIVLILLLLNLFSGEQNTGREIAYSEFIQQVRTGQIASVVLSGEQVLGRDRAGREFLVIAPKDPALVETLRGNAVAITVEPDHGPPWYVNLLIHWAPFLLIIAVWVFIFQRMQAGGNRLFSLGRSRARRADETAKEITFAQVAGVEEEKEELSEIIAFLKNPAQFETLGGHIPKGVLLTGPPGTGKTLLAKAVAGEAGVPFFSISGSEFVEMFVGVGASRVRDLFEEGRKNAPCILFIDEIDAVGRHRGAGLGNGHDEREQTLNQLLVEMDGFDTGVGVTIIAATNRPDVLDHALLRPGRFDRHIEVSLPNTHGREQILKIHTKHVRLAKGVQLNVIARGTPNFSGADLRNLVNEAALHSARKNLRSVTLKELEWARDKVMMGPERRSMIVSEEERNTTAYHEAGHALLGALLPKADPVHKITIIPRGAAMGLTSFLPREDRHMRDQEYLLDNITVTMGGRAAEEIVFNERSTGASQDLQQATHIARNMVTQWGMSETIGPVNLGSEDQLHFLGRDIGGERLYGEETAEMIDEEVHRILKTCYLKACQVLREHLEVLHGLAKRLVDQETVNNEDLQNLISGTT